jgi:hypothetical protein
VIVADNYDRSVLRDDVHNDEYYPNLDDHGYQDELNGDQFDDDSDKNEQQDPDNHGIDLHMLLTC